jgi:hypothetical protein
MSETKNPEPERFVAMGKIWEECSAARVLYPYWRFNAGGALRYYRAVGDAFDSALTAADVRAEVLRLRHSAVEWTFEQALDFLIEFIDKGATIAESAESYRQRVVTEVRIIAAVLGGRYVLDELEDWLRDNPPESELRRQDGGTE